MAVRRGERHQGRFGSLGSVPLGVSFAMPITNAVTTDSRRWDKEPEF